MDGPDLPQLHVLVVEDDPHHAACMRQALLRMEPGVRVTTVDRLRGALEALRDPAIGCVVTDLRLADAEDAGVVCALRAVRREVPIIVVTGAGSEELAVAAMKLGAADYVTKHARYVEQLPVLVREALGRSVLAGVDPGGAELAPVAGGAADEHFLVGSAAGLRALLALVDRAARSAVPVLIEGGTGTGKELIARAIHRRGPRRHASLLVQNCAALSESLLESELFGHCRGAFTGAERDRRGLFEEAGDGTVFLDEIGEAPLVVQAKLLRVLQHEEVKAVGADRARRMRARIVARVELALIRQRLQQKSTKSAAARSLGITREALYAKMKRLGLSGG